MRKIGKFLGRLLLVLVVLIGAAFVLDPKPHIEAATVRGPSSLPEDLDAYLAASEAQFTDIVPGTEKQIIWNGEKGAKTPLSVVYLHGYSASLFEIRPVPDEVAKALGANLFYTRLTGHARGADPMGQATPADWMRDAAEAIAVGRRLGDRVLVIATSTGGTLAAILAADPALSQNVAGLVFVSPNFALTPRAARIVNLPFAPVWGPVLFGEYYEWTPRSDLQAQYWTTRYPTAAVFPLRDLVNYAVAQDYTKVKIPALFYFSLTDHVVDPDATQKVVAEWGGPKQVINPVMGPGDDPGSHLIAGDIASPGQTAPAIAAILDWAKGL